MLVLFLLSFLLLSDFSPNLRPCLSSPRLCHICYHGLPDFCRNGHSADGRLSGISVRLFLPDDHSSVSSAAASVAAAVYFLLSSLFDLFCSFISVRSFVSFRTSALCSFCCRPLCSLWSLCLSCCCVLCRRALCRTAVICLHLFSLSGILTVSAGSSSFITAVLCILRTEYMHDISFSLVFSDFSVFCLYLFLYLYLTYDLPPLRNCLILCVYMLPDTFCESLIKDHQKMRGILFPHCMPPMSLCLCKNRSEPDKKSHMF